MIYLWAAKPRSGKTYLMVRLLVETLVHSKKYVVTNLTELRLDKLQAYLQKRYPRCDADVTRRVRIIPKSDTRNFFRFRGDHDMPPIPDQILEKTTGPERRDSLLSEYFKAEAERNAVGVTYLLDEAHRHFSADSWASLGPTLMFYNTQHGHLDDNIYLSTQSPEFVAIPFRRLCDEARRIVNTYRQSWLVWKKPGGFKWLCYYTVADMLANRDHYDQGGTTLEPDGIGSCYYTRGALGGKDLGPEERPASKKLPFWTAYAAAIAAVATLVTLVWVGPDVAMGMLFRIVGMKRQTQEQSATVSSSPVRLPSVGQPGRQSSRFSSESSGAPRVYVRSVTQTQGRYRVELTDGRVMNEVTGGVRAVSRGMVQLESGEILSMMAVQPSGSKSVSPVSRAGDADVRLPDVVEPPPREPGAGAEGRESLAVVEPIPASESPPQVEALRHTTPSPAQSSGRPTVNQSGARMAPVPRQFRR